jgi:tryptophan halogenase
MQQKTKRKRKNIMINNITIVGGGSAGWMTATTLLNRFPDKKITLVESPNISNIGVGESTVAGSQSGFSGFGDWLKFVGLKGNFDYMPHCDAIFKLSIAFENWYRKDSGTFHYPFGTPVIPPNIIPNSELNDWYFKKILHPETPVSDYAESSFPGMALVNKNKSLFTKSFTPLMGQDANLPSSFDESNNEVQLQSGWGLQFNATEFGIWLRDNYCKTKYANNFTHILAEVEETPLNENGIEHLVLDNGQKLEADLFIDCTGFKSLLLTKAFKVPFISIENFIPNNYAWATKIPYKDPETQIVNYTKCTAIENGWIWEIPLWSRMGSGYVFSDKFVSSEEALKEFKQGLIKKGYENVEELEYNLIPMKCGYQSKLWVKNTCAIGLAAGFIEPLQSNGLQSVHLFLLNLCRTLERGHISEWDRKEFTAKCHDDFNGLATVVALSYTLSHRDDTEYWRDIQNREYPVELFSPTAKDGISSVLFTKYFDKNFRNKFDPGDTIWNCMSVGMNWNPLDIHLIKYNMGDIEKIKKNIEIHTRQIEERKKKWNEEIKYFPSPYEYLRDNIHINNG